jgi:hypothetical protein
MPSYSSTSRPGSTTTTGDDHPYDVKAWRSAYDAWKKRFDSQVDNRVDAFRSDASAWRPGGDSPFPNLNLPGMGTMPMPGNFPGGGGGSVMPQPPTPAMPGVGTPPVPQLGPMPQMPAPQMPGIPTMPPMGAMPQRPPMPQMPMGMPGMGMAPQMPTGMPMGQPGGGGLQALLARIAAMRGGMPTRPPVGPQMPWLAGMR